MSLTITRLGVALGAEVRGIDLAQPLDEATADSLRTALYDHQVLVFRGQDLDRDQHLAVAAIFGRPTPPEPAGHLGQTDPVQVFVRDASHKQTAEHWHTDTPFMADPPIAGVLMPLKVPKLGGDTAWVSLYAVYNGLSGPIRTLCEGLQGEHSMSLIRGYIRDLAGLSAEQLVAVDDAFPDYCHPLVQNHWVTGKPLIYDGGDWMSRVVGLNSDENTMLRDLLRRQIDKAEYLFRWKWTLGDIAVWDERSTNHKGMSDHFEIDPDRTMRSIFVSRAEHSMPRARL